MAPCHQGNIIDPPVTRMWTISHPQASPTTLSLTNNPNNSPNGIWFTPPTSSSFTYEYIGGLDTPPLYNGIIVNESKSTPLANGIFGLDDILDSKRRQLGTSVTADDIANMLFSKSDEDTFVFNQQHTITDTHQGFLTKLGSLRDLRNWFTPNAISNKRVGYMMEQKFESCGNDLLNTKINRRFDVPSHINFMDFRKDH